MLTSLSSDPFRYPNISYLYLKKPQAYFYLGFFVYRSIILQENMAPHMFKKQEGMK